MIIAAHKLYMTSEVIRNKFYTRNKNEMLYIPSSMCWHIRIENICILLLIILVIYVYVFTRSWRSLLPQYNNRYAIASPAEASPRDSHHYLTKPFVRFSPCQVFKIILSSIKMS